MLKVHKASHWQFECAFYELTCNCASYIWSVGDRLRVLEMCVLPNKCQCVWWECATQYKTCIFGLPVLVEGAASWIAMEMYAAHWGVNTSIWSFLSLPRWFHTALWQQQAIIHMPKSCKQLGKCFLGKPVWFVSLCLKVKAANSEEVIQKVLNHSEGGGGY